MLTVVEDEQHLAVPEGIDQLRARCLRRQSHTEHVGDGRFQRFHAGEWDEVNEPDPVREAIQTLATTGSALLGSALTTAFGFGVLIASPLLASAQFGITATITIVYSLAVSILVVLPAMVVWGAYQNMRMRSMVERMWDDLDVAIEDISQRHHGDAAPS